MIQSMTGYGRGFYSCDGREITVELKSVNHRYLDVSMRLPRSIGFLEETLRSCLSSVLRRGHVDIYVNYRNLRVDARVINVDNILVGQYVAAANTISELYGVKNDLTASSLMRLPDAVEILEAAEDRTAVMELCKNACDIALNELVIMRTTEGKRLFSDLSLRLKTITGLVDQIKERAPCVADEYRDKLNERIASFLLDVEIDRARLATEVALFADRASVDEEITRLYSHICQFAGILDEGAEAGRKLDFVVQEMNREFNTIGSKANDSELVDIVLRSKAEIEKVREQVQNIE